MLAFLGKLFGLTGERSPEWPVRFEQRIRIKGKPEELYPLVDWSDERHLWRQLGNSITGEGDQFQLRITELPDTRFDIRVTDAVPPTLYAYDDVTVPMIGKLISSHEEYRFDDLGGGECAVTLTVEAKFVPGLRPGTWKFEQSKMQISCHNAVSKLKLMAEQGVDAVRAASRRLVV